VVPKRILAIHDLSGFGHTSLLAVIPIMYRMGIEVATMPTTLLSANTDFPGYRRQDNTAMLKQVFEHWKELELRFDAVYTGFLGDPGQVEIILEYLPEMLKPNAIVLVDPVLGDDGKLYSCFDDSVVHAMKNLVACSDIITPNFTEAALLLGNQFNSSPESLLAWCKDLSKLGPKQIIITSAPCESGDNSKLVHYSKGSAVVSEYECNYVPVSYPGAGDCFASILLAALLNGNSLATAIKGSCEFIRHAFAISLPIVEDRRTGIALAAALAKDPHSFFSE